MVAHHAARKKHGWIFTVLLSVLALLLAAACILSWMVLSDPNAGKGLEDITPSEVLGQTVAKSALTGQVCTFGKDEVNGFLSYLIRQQGEAEGEFTFRAAAVTVMENDEAELYLPVTYQGKNFGVTTRVDPFCDPQTNQLVFTVRSLKIGRLPVSPGWALDWAEDRLPEGFERVGNQIRFTDSSLLEASYAGFSAKLQLRSVAIEDGRLKILSGVSVALPAA